MKHNTDLGSRIASVHSGSALFTGDAGSGANEIRKELIEKDWLDCVIALPTNIFYNTGIPTYILILNNKKPIERKGKIQLINAVDIYEKLRKNLGEKNCEMKPEHIKRISELYLDFKPTEISKIYNTDYFGYNQITVERPLRLSSKFTDVIETLRYDNSIKDEMMWAYTHFGEDIYKDLKKFRLQIERHLNTNEVKLSSTNKNKLLSQEFWKEQLNIMTCAETLAKHFGDVQFDDYNKFSVLLNKTINDLKLKLEPKSIKLILETISWRNQNAERVIDKTDKDGTVHYIADSELRDTEKVPLDQDIHEYFQREVLKYIPDAWIDETKTVKGYEIAFSRYFHKYDAPVFKNISATFKQYKEYNPVSADYFSKLPKGWEYLPNIAIFNEKLERNKNDAELLSVTITSGVIRQSEVDKNDTSNSDKSKYKFINPNDIVYNKMRMWQGAVGASIHSGIVSPAYIVVSPKIKIDSKYFHYQLRSSYYINYSKRFSYGLCDDMLSLRYTDFKRMYSILPPIETQVKIAKALTTIDNYLLNKLTIIQKIMGRKIVLQSNNIENSLYDFIVWQLISGQVDVDSIKIDEIENIVDKLFTES